MPESPSALSLQERYAPHSICYGCGPANPLGFRIRSFPQGDEVVTEWRAEPQHQAFEGAINGGVISTLFDCHCNWTAAYHLMKRNDLPTVPATVTAELSVRYKRPTRSDAPVLLRAHVVESTDDRATVEATLESGGVICATCRATFVAVQPGHPAYHRWE